jgi:hypothetical protein
MRNLLQLLPLAALLSVSAVSATQAATMSPLASTNCIPVEWSEGWSAGSYFVRQVEAQYGKGTAQTRQIIEEQIDVYLDGGSFEDLDDYGQGYVYRLQRAI